jgi:large subunit ribosomal protein L31e
MADRLERIYTVPLGDAYRVPRVRRARRAVKLLREFVGRHMKAETEDVSLSNALNSHLWEKSAKKPPRRVKVRLIKENGKVRAYLADEKIEEKKPKKEEKPKEEKKKPEEKKEVEEKKEELKREQRAKAEEAMADKEAKKAIKEEEAKIEEAKKRKFAHGKET